jgi:hypothetical protein
VTYVPADDSFASSSNAMPVGVRSRWSFIPQTVYRGRSPHPPKPKKGLPFAASAHADPGRERRRKSDGGAQLASGAPHSTALRMSAIRGRRRHGAVAKSKVGSKIVCARLKLVHPVGNALTARRLQGRVGDFSHPSLPGETQHHRRELRRIDRLGKMHRIAGG